VGGMLNLAEFPGKKADFFKAMIGFYNGYRKTYIFLTRFSRKKE
jgi:hypothetical protein